MAFAAPKLFRKIAGLILVVGWLWPLSSDALAAGPFSRVFLPDIDQTHVHQLADRIYYFPANRTHEEETRYLPLRKWDLIFTGDYRNQAGDEFDHENINWLIPGPFNHIMVYIGKDSRGMAYAIELNTASFFDPGGLVLICLGSDYGLMRFHEETALHDRKRLTHRWAMRFRTEARNQILRSEENLLNRLATDLALGFPYQLEFRHSGNLFDPTVYLVDDGFTGGAGCSDYWTTLFEEYAGLCLKDVRVSVAELEAYFQEDPEGVQAYAPEILSPFPQPIRIKAILDLGYEAVADAPHIFPCDGTSETGLVLPSLIFESPLLEEIPAVGWPITLPWVLLKP
ncbi:MAG TPA: hypothetical protein VJ960_05505 [Oceanipulchritudo sp.]|nr:hypothetical protein [Oceanipulchritudo sp.]